MNDNRTFECYNICSCLHLFSQLTISGLKPNPLSCRTLCCVGFVFCSPVLPGYTIYTDVCTSQVNTHIDTHVCTPNINCYYMLHTVPWTLREETILTILVWSRKSLQDFCNIVAVYLWHEIFDMEFLWAINIT